VTEPPPSWDRPDLSGTELVADEAGFRFHFTYEGEDAIAPTDSDGDEVPDTIERMADGFEAGLASFDARGFVRPLGDDGVEGSTDIDVYVRALDSYGYTHPLSVPEGYGCFIELDRDMDGSLEGIVESVAAHELHHCVEFAYTIHMAPWWYEATATHEQYLAVSGEGLAGAVDALWGLRLFGSSRPVDDVGSRFEYAGMILPKFWEEFGGDDPGRSARMWEEARTEPDWEALFGRVAADELGLGWDALFQEHAVWNALACGHDDGEHYQPDAVACTIDSITVPAADASSGSASVQLEGAWSAGYVSFRPDDPTLDLEVTCEGPETMRLTVLALDGILLADQVEGQAGTATVHATPEVLAVVTAGEAGSVTCTSREVARGEEQDGCGCSTSPRWNPAGLAVLGAVVAWERRRRRGCAPTIVAVRSRPYRG
jgi:MYXO-CTERM domain-containing protein